jgi:hypothetical protein
VVMADTMPPAGRYRSVTMVHARYRCAVHRRLPRSRAHR